MYSIEAFSTFTLMRPVFITFLVLAVILLIAVVLFKIPKWITAFTISIVSIISIVVCAQLLFLEGIIVDELNLSGDPASLYMFFAITLLSILNLLIYSFRLEKRRGSA
ncbi:hypothetical protein [Psychrobacillus sp. BL-248-WT-3]|uniref:hypothetical protein n=1 Tax=Psychrobacillus sp. BL-248-WT-3 TaxID=2725306 RepID=UPI00146D1709|nr:hypothetical protein [Psychrobacillus sp. BL-248-WT-3]NME06017.1 hypothetical protein [Psychrobacillus sp. BL-248-WT-3]